MEDEGSLESWGLDYGFMLGTVLSPNFEGPGSVGHSIQKPTGWRTPAVLTGGEGAPPHRDASPALALVMCDLGYFRPQFTVSEDDMLTIFHFPC